MILFESLYLRSQREIRQSETLQWSLLPVGLPELEGWTLSAHYETAAGGRVGGDWYDVIELGESTVAVVLGDVVLLFTFPPTWRSVCPRGAARSALPTVELVSSRALATAKRDTDQPKHREDDGQDPQHVESETCAGKDQDQQQQQPQASFPIHEGPRVGNLYLPEAVGSGTNANSSRRTARQKVNDMKAVMWKGERNVSVETVPHPSI
jgi:Alcohol dehydrogenase GroES-associated